MLKRIIKFLVDDSKWSLEYVPTCPNALGCQNAEVLKVQIKSLLSGDDLSTTDFNRIYRHVALEDRVSQGMHKNAKKFLQIIRFYGFHQQKLTADETKWLIIKDKLAELLACDRVKCNFDIEEVDIDLKGDAIRFLRELGYEIPLVEGRFGVTQADEVKFGEAMRYRFNKIGAVSIMVILDNIRHLYNKKTGRYDFRPEPASIGIPQIVPPWGYLLNVALSFIRGKNKQKNFEKTFNEIVDISSKYFTALELQPLSRFADAFRSYSEIVDEIEEVILYNQHIALDQYPLEVILEIITDLEYALVSTQGNPIVRVLEWICKRKKSEMPETMRFTRDEIEKDLSGLLSPSQMTEVLDCLVIEDNVLNQRYYIPSAVSLRNYYKRPLVLNNGYYYLFDSNLWAKGFYLAWLDKYGKNCDLGALFESVVQRQLSSKNVKFLSGQKYKITSEERAALGITSEEGECDFVIETVEKIYFLELKKKEITGNAMSGDSLAALADMSKSALAAFIQGAKHELVLRKRGEIRFTSGNKIVMDGKQIEKIHISAFDRYGLHDKLLIERLLRSLIMCTFNCEDESRLSPLKSAQDEFNAIVNSAIIKMAYANGSYLLSFRSFSLPQFMFALRGCKSEADFAEHIDMTSHIVTGTKDWYKEQVFMLTVRNR